MGERRARRPPPRPRRPRAVSAPARLARPWPARSRSAPRPRPPLLRCPHRLPRLPPRACPRGGVAPTGPLRSPRPRSRTPLPRRTRDRRPRSARPPTKAHPPARPRPPRPSRALLLLRSRATNQPRRSARTRPPAQRPRPPAATPTCCVAAGTRSSSACPPLVASRGRWSAATLSSVPLTAPRWCSSSPSRPWSTPSRAALARPTSKRPSTRSPA